MNVPTYFLYAGLYFIVTGAIIYGVQELLKKEPEPTPIVLHLRMDGMGIVTLQDKTGTNAPVVIYMDRTP